MSEDDEVQKEPDLISQFYFGRSYNTRLKEPKQEVLAKILLGSEDIHARAVEWMVKHSVVETNSIKGFMLSQASADEPPAYHMSFNCSNPRDIFDLFRLVTAKNRDFSSVLTATAVLANEIENNLPASVNAGARSLDEVQVGASGTIERVVPDEQVEEEPQSLYAVRQSVRDEAVAQINAILQGELDEEDEDEEDELEEDPRRDTDW